MGEEFSLIFHYFSTHFRHFFSGFFFCGFSPRIRQELTLWSQESFLILGFAWMWHSKYKSSPSLISSLDKVEPSWMFTKGGSVKMKEKKIMKAREQKGKIENIHHNMMMEKVCETSLIKWFMTFVKKLLFSCCCCSLYTHS